jgi:hypothetical protein
MYGLSLLKSYKFFCGTIMDKYVFISFFKNLDQILILLLLLCCNIEKESLNCPYKAVQFFIYFLKMDYNGKYERRCNFSAIFCILLDAHAVQYGINFDNSIEIQLTYRK